MKTCSVGDCDRKTVARGWCTKHYKRWKSTGDPDGLRSTAVVCAPGCGCGRHKKAAVVVRITKGGYIELSGQYGHPLAAKNGQLLEHRKVLYAKIGPGLHQCHWCGTDVIWGGRGTSSIHVDHIDTNRLNNDPDNLVPSCYRCNMNRHRDNLLDVKDIRAIRELYKAGKLTQKAIGEVFGVSDPTVSRIINHKLWWIEA